MLKYTEVKERIKTFIFLIICIFTYISELDIHYILLEILKFICRTDIHSKINVGHESLNVILSLSHPALKYLHYYTWMSNFYTKHDIS